MKKTFLLMATGILVACSQALAGDDATAVGAYWAFQRELSGTTTADSTFTESVTYHNLATVLSFSRTGEQLGQFIGVGNYQFTHFNGDTWARGRTATWNGNANPSANNRFEITIDTTDATDFSVRFSYRNNGLKLDGVPITSMLAFEYKVGTAGSFASVPGAKLTLVNNKQNNTWSADLSSLDAIEGQSQVTLR